MPAQNSRIPRTIDEFNTYIDITNTYLLAGTPTNWSRLAWTQAEMTQWTTFNTQWKPAFLKYSDKKGSRTTAITEQLHLIIKNCVTLDKTNHLLDRIAAAAPGAQTITDLQTFNIKAGSQAKAPSHTHTAIAEAVVVSLQAIGGGDVQIKCRTGHDSKHSSIVDGADSVQYLYQIGGTAPANAETAGLIKEHSTKASFTIHLGAASAEKRLYIFFRWYNSKYPALAGPWSGANSTPIG